MKLDEVIQQPGQMERIQQEAVLNRIRVSIPGFVIRYDKENQCVDVQPAIRDSDSSEKPQILLNVPVWFPGAYSYNVNAGDECLVVFADRCIDAWWQSGKISSPFTAREHDLSDGIALVGIRSQPNSDKGKTFESEFDKKIDKVSDATNGNFAGLDSNGNVTDSGYKASDFVSAASIAGKADKVEGATPGNFAGLDASGNLTDSRKKPSDFLTEHQDISGKADKVSEATAGDFAGLDANGNLTDSGKKPSDFLTQHQDISGKADKVESATNGHLAGLNSSGNLTDSGLSASSVENMVLIPSAAISIPSVDNSPLTVYMTGMTANHRLVQWNFSVSAENKPPVKLKWETFSGYFQITNYGGSTTTQTIQPMFVNPKAVTTT